MIYRQNSIGGNHGGAQPNQRQAGPWEIAGAEQAWRRAWHPITTVPRRSPIKTWATNCRKFSHSHAKRAIALVKDAKKQRWHVRCSGFG